MKTAFPRAACTGLFALLCLLALPLHAAEPAAPAALELRDGGIIRGPKDEKKIALEFTGHTFAEGGEEILNVLAKHQAKASFFFTGDFLRNPKFKPVIKRIIKDGHFLSIHSDKHLLYCPWDGTKKTLVSKEAFAADLDKNFAALEKFGVKRAAVTHWIPPYEHYNQEIVDWSREQKLTLINYSPGTRSNADYTGDNDKNYVPSQVIMDSIVKKERDDPHGLNGFLLLLHIGVGPNRQDKMHFHVDDLLQYLGDQGYQFVRVDDLLQPKAEKKTEKTK